MLTQQQIEERQNGIFSTDAPAALGFSRYSSPADVFMRKTGQMAAPDLSANEAVQMGNFMEPVIARLYEERQGIALMQLPITMWHPTHTFMGSHFDYKQKNANKLVEIKNFSATRRGEFGENGSDEVPMDVLIQCIHEATVFGTDAIDLAVLFGGQQFCVFGLTIDTLAKDRLIELEEEFWRTCIVERKAPLPRTVEEARALFPNDAGTALVADTNLILTVDRLKQIKQSIKDLEVVEDQLSAEIQGQLGEHNTVMSQEGTVLATWKKSKDSKRFDKDSFEKQHPSLYAQFTVSQPGSRRFLVK